jgi:glycosyltransferase involved in cell wall biosynthesis
MTTRTTVAAGGDTAPAGATAEGRGGCTRRRLLYIYPDTMGLSAEPQKNPLHYLSRYFEGDYLAVWIVPDDETARRREGEGRAANGRFSFHWLRRNRSPAVLRRLSHLLFYVRRGLQLSRSRGGYDVIVVYGPFATALAGVILRRLTGARLIIEFPGHPFRSYDLVSGWVNRLKRRVAPAWTRYVARTADRVRLLYPSQLDDLGIDVSAKASVFHEFTTVRSAAPTPGPLADRPYIFFMGFPFHLKGVDVLIRAFNRITDRFPDHRLVIAGYCPDPERYVKLAGGNPRVEIRPPVPHDEAMRLMAGCSLFVLPSRMEGMGRVLLEAMAARRPIVASAVGGIPHYVQHERHGLLFESEQDQDLARQMERVLADPDFAARLAAAGHEYVRSTLSEEQYAERFRDMVEAALAPARYRT